MGESQNDAVTRIVLLRFLMSVTMDRFETDRRHKQLDQDLASFRGTCSELLEGA